MQSVEYKPYQDVDSKNQHDQVNINECVKSSNETPNKKARDSAAKCHKITMGMSCLLFAATCGGFAAISVLHHESQGTWNRDTLQLQHDMESEHDQAALALKSLNESIRSDLLDVKADISKIETSQDNQNTYIDLILVKLLGWQRSEHVVYKYFRQAVSYGTAEIRCEGYPGGRLAAKALRDPQVVSNIISIGGIGTSKDNINKPWIGFDDRSIEGDWSWSDDGMMKDETTAWLANQPDSLGGNQDCAQIFHATGGKLHLNDNRCDSAYYYICEVDK